MTHTVSGYPVGQHPNSLANLSPGGKPHTNASPRKSRLYHDYQEIMADRLDQRMQMLWPLGTPDEKRGKHEMKVQRVVEHIVDRLIVMALNKNLAAIKLVMEISNGRVPGSMQDAITTLLEEGDNASYSQAVRFAQTRLEDVYARIESEFPAPGNEGGFVPAPVDGVGEA